MPSNRYTIICEFRGGTYISQIEAEDELDALDQWCAIIQTDKPIPRSSAHVAKAVRRDIKDRERAAPLDGLVGVWCFSSLMGGDLVLINIVHTR